MSFSIDPTKPLAEEVRRIADEQIGKALSELREPEEDRHEAIHDVRKRAKKLRALLRLVRDGDEGLYRRENARLRDLAGRLSGTRDRTALIEAAEGLSEALGGEGGPLRPVREVLEQRRDAAVAAEGDLDAAIAATIAELEESEARVEAAAFGKADRRIVARGYARNYAEARRALKVAERSGKPDDFHELRKRAKYYMNHLRLLSELWPDALKPLHDTAERVAEDLGRDHDYAVLLAEIAAEPEAFGPQAERETAVGLIAEHSAELRAQALSASRRLFALKPKASRRQIESLWREAARPQPTPSV
ncbi:CHAD domain-containing protein [Aureimonas endophytica]|uniref:CHAD domain-containing protein n=1 Tax=Aureimonas endophytica TaxID=2027858 RepID=A0A917E9Q0_9HYPH|nr:CHAD domain-containing protein [Aureimonas endophytica]GGE17723.1 CHAD domain-containing protein [Aureimonas endophytica]